ncbi:MAG TPA: glycosyltransferase family 4 protein [Steroidobacteraceae bacterium]|jgi:glycosyltransferase involved in cell wall biosynthesis|nr:glycosyltransferase family 4 protein [Steroidobacteraceae bacterium]
MTTRIAIFHPADPAGHVPGGIDTIIRGMLKWAPSDLDYTIFGATSDESSRPVGREARLEFGGPNVHFVPLTRIDPSSRRAAIPVTLRYMLAVRTQMKRGLFDSFDALDFHRIETLWLFRHDRRPKNIIVHQDMSIIRDPGCDIAWRHAPWLYERIEGGVLPSAAHVYAVRQTAVERYRKTYPQLAQRISFLPTWVDTAIFTPPADAAERDTARATLRARLGLSDASVRVLTTVGRLDKQKDPLLLIEAFAQASPQANLHLVLVGDGVLRSNVEQLCSTLKLSGQVSFVGVQPPLQIASILRGSDLFVLSSAYEGMPIAVLEALATGLPVVSTNVGEIPLLIKNGISGQIASERTAQGLSAAVGAALDQVAAMRGKPSEDAVSPFRPELILRSIYENHRSQQAG